MTLCCPWCGFTDITPWSQMSCGGEATGFVCDFCGHRWGDGFPDDLPVAACDRCGMVTPIDLPCPACTGRPVIA